MRSDFTSATYPLNGIEGAQHLNVYRIVLGENCRPILCARRDRTSVNRPVIRVDVVGIFEP